MFNKKQAKIQTEIFIEKNGVYSEKFIFPQSGNLNFFFDTKDSVKIKIYCLDKEGSYTRLSLDNSRVEMVSISDDPGIEIIVQIKNDRSHQPAIVKFGQHKPSFFNILLNKLLDGIRNLI